MDLMRPSSKTFSNNNENSKSGNDRKIRSMPPVLSALTLLKRKRHWDDSTVGPPRLFLLLPSIKNGDATEARQQNRLEVEDGINELTGEAGTGKTQLALSLCVSCALLPFTAAVDAIGGHTSTAAMNGPTNEDRQYSGVGGVRAVINPYSTPRLEKSRHGCIQKDDARSQQAAIRTGPVDRNLVAAKEVRNPYALPFLPAPDQAAYTKNGNPIQKTRNNNSSPPLKSLYPANHLTASPSLHQEQLLATNNLQYYSALYVSMGEGVTQSQLAYRLSQMVQARVVSSSLTLAECVMNRIYTRFVRNEDDFFQWMDKELPSLLSSHDCNTGRIGIIVLDSLAGLFRSLPSQFRATNYAERSRMFFCIGAKLKRLSDEYHVRILVVNQVTACVNNMEGDRVKPSLGMSWSNCVNTRFLLSRVEQPEFAPQQIKVNGNRFARRATVLLSSNRPNNSVPFLIHTAGGVLE